MIAPTHYEKVIAGEGTDPGVTNMPNPCPECGKPLASDPCSCVLSQPHSGARATGGRAESGTEKLKKSLEEEVKAREQENDRTKKAIRELLGRKLELMTTGVGWLKTYHALVFGAYEPKAAVKERMQPEIPGETIADVKATKAEIAEAPSRKTSAGEIVALALVVIVLAALVLPIAAMAILIVSPIVILLLGIAAVVLAVIYAKMAYKFMQWTSVNAARSGEEKAALAIESEKLDVEIEALRRRHVAEQAGLQALRRRSKEVSEALRAKGRIQEGGSPPATGTVLLPGFEEMAEITAADEGPSPDRPRGVYGLIRAATNVVPIRKCPKCRASFATVSDGEEVLDTKSWLVGGRPEGDIFEKEPVAEKVITVAKKSKCGKCGHGWREVSDVGKTVRGACPSCHENSRVEAVGEDELKTDYEVVGGGPGKNYFQGRSEVRVHAEYLKKFHCKKCALRWCYKASRNWTANGVCPACYSDRKEPILREKVRSHDTRQTKKQSDVIINRNCDPVGQTIREESVVIREDWWEATFRCRSCLHEWKELSSESYRAF